MSCSPCRAGGLGSIIYFGSGAESWGAQFGGGVRLGREASLVNSMAEFGFGPEGNGKPVLSLKPGGDSSELAF